VKIRAKANGNVLDVSPEEAETLLATGIYERDESDDTVTTQPIESYQTRSQAGRHKRKDLRAEP
jgi:hypothetical protein